MAINRCLCGRLTDYGLFCVMCSKDIDTKNSDESSLEEDTEELKEEKELEWD